MGNVYSAILLLNIEFLTFDLVDVHVNPYATTSSGFSFLVEIPRTG